MIKLTVRTYKSDTVMQLFSFCVQREQPFLRGVGDWKKNCFWFFAIEFHAYILGIVKFQTRNY